MISVFTRSFASLFDFKILFLSLVPITLAALFWAAILYLFSDQIHAGLVALLGHIPYGDSEVVLDAVELLGGLFIFYQLLIVTSVMIVGLIADQVVDRVNAKRYQLEKNGFGSLTGSIVTSLKSNVVFILLFILLLPLAFVPVVNIVVNVLLWMVLIRSPLFYDSLALYATRPEYQALKDEKRSGLTTITLLAASLFLIPVIGVFIYVLQLLFFTHFNLQRLQNIRTK